VEESVASESPRTRTEEREGDHIGDSEVVGQQVVARVAGPSNQGSQRAARIASQADRDCVPGRAGLGAEASIAFGGTFHTRLNHCTKMSASARRTGSDGHRRGERDELLQPGDDQRRVGQDRASSNSATGDEVLSAQRPIADRSPVEWSTHSTSTPLWAAASATRRRWWIHGIRWTRRSIAAASVVLVEAFGGSSCQANQPLRGPAPR